MTTHSRALCNAQHPHKGSVAMNFMTSDRVPTMFPLLPAGPEIIGRDGRRWLLSDPVQLVAAFAAGGVDLPIDIEHSTELKGPEGEPAPAVAWIKGLKIIDGQIWGEVEWTEDGAWQVGSKQYRYISPVFQFDKGTLEIIRLTSVGLTNKPNLGLPALNHQQQENAPMWKRLLAKLALAESATEDDAINAVSKLQGDLVTAINRAETPSMDRFVPRADYDLAMNRATTAEQQLATQAQHALDTAINTEIDQAMKLGKIAPASKAFYVAACRQEGGLEQFKTFLTTAPVIAAPSGMDGQSPPEGTTALNAEQQKIAQMFGNSADDLKKYGAA